MSIAAQDQGVTANTRRLLRELVIDVLGTREDRKVLTPVLLAMVRGAVTDFEQFYDRRHAANRVREFDMLLARNRSAKERQS